MAWPLVLGPERGQEACSVPEAGLPLLAPMRVPIPSNTSPCLSPSQLQQKAVASEIFRGKKDNYPQSVPRLFISTRLGEPLTSSAPTLQHHPAWSPLPSSYFLPPSLSCRCGRDQPQSAAGPRL